MSEEVEVMLYVMLSIVVIASALTWAVLKLTVWEECE